MMTLLTRLISWIRSHQVLCAWCQKEGVRTALKWSWARNSHGICPKCCGNWLKEAGL